MYLLIIKTKEKEKITPQDTKVFHGLNKETNGEQQ